MLGVPWTNASSVFEQVEGRPKRIRHRVTFSKIGREPAYERVAAVGREVDELDEPR
jgi:hypothetical protein